MPGRQSHGAPPSKRVKSKNNSQKRVLDAFSIASHQAPDKVKVRHHRLGQQEGGVGRNKRRRSNENNEDEDDEEGAVQPKKLRKGPEKGRFDELDLDEGSDSEGNEWKLGQVDSDDDSDLDSDEAFGESDEERFEGFAFSGSSEKVPKKKTLKHKDINLDEDDVVDSGSELEEDDLGEGAVDLADMLDMSEGDDGSVNSKDQADITETDEDDEENTESEQSEDDSMSSADEDNDTADPAKLAALRNLVATLPQADESRAIGKQRSDGVSEYSTPSEFRLTSKTKLTLEDLDLPMIHDPQIKKSLKLLQPEKSGKKVAPKLEVPLAKRQQDRLDRSAAYEKSKETLDRWTDTVKHNRRAGHLMFPLVDHDLASAHLNKELAPTRLTKPFNELEATIQSILEESGLATIDGKDDEDHIREFEELQTNKLSVEEVKARTDQLRMARDLLFREEAKAKRIKKIKSKSYRKVHRKQREKQDRLNQEALAEGGYAPSEDELDKQDRRRAEERMGAKHRGSKWAKAMKESGRTTWDEDARSGVTEMARRSEELRKRVEGRAVRKEFDDDSDQSSDDSDDDGSADGESAERQRLLQKLEDVGTTPLLDKSLPGARLANMDFMRRADASRKMQNDTMVEEMRRELAGEEKSSDEEAAEIGRRAFGPGRQTKSDMSNQATHASEFEEAANSDTDGDGVEFTGFDETPEKAPALTTQRNSKSGKRLNSTSFSTQPASNSEGGAWSKVSRNSTTINNAESSRRRHKKNQALEIEDIDLSQAAVITNPPKTQNSAKRSSTSEVRPDADSEEENAVQLPFAIRDQELIKRAFAGADVVGEFEAEKKQTVEDEEDKVIDETLPGWGSWVGDGLSKKAMARNVGKVLKKVDGIKADKRKDAKLERVIINEKRVKKNGKYLASSLPHPFETRQQYERSLRLPIGPEWTTKETFQDATKPRILLKQGVIAPMSRPLL